MFAQGKANTPSWQAPRVYSGILNYLPLDGGTKVWFFFFFLACVFLLCFVLV